MRLWLFLPLIVLVACAEYERPASSKRRDDVRAQDEREDQGGVDVVESAPPRAAKQTARASAGAKADKKAEDAGQAKVMSQRRAAAANSGSGGMAKPAPKARDAGAQEAGSMSAGRTQAPASDAGPINPPDAAPPDAATEQTQNTGSCCSASALPGCNDAALRACVCEREPRCCSEAWDETCTRLVKEKHCQSGVRDCVCGFGEGQWQQVSCCQGGWNDSCESVARIKCEAKTDCP